MKRKNNYKLVVGIIIANSLLLFGCNGCSPSGRNATQQRNVEASQSYSKPEQRGSRHQSHSRSTVRMQKRNGVFYIPVKLNGVDMEVIFDTGASDIVISSVEALFLIRQGKLAEEDVLGQAYYSIADGSMAAGTVINLRSVEIGGRVLNNVRATVVDNIEAPLLLGQSALAQFGKVSIDYNSNTIQFE